MRRVTGQNLWIWYRFDAELVTFEELDHVFSEPLVFAMVA